MCACSGLYARERERESYMLLQECVREWNYIARVEWREKEGERSGRPGKVRGARARAGSAWYTRSTCASPSLSPRCWCTLGAGRYLYLYTVLRACDFDERVRGGTPFFRPFFISLLPNARLFSECAHAPLCRGPPVLFASLAFSSAPR